MSTLHMPLLTISTINPSSEFSAATQPYTIEGCFLSYTIKNARVDAVSASVTKGKCRPVVLGQEVSASDTFGKYAGGNGFLAADCLSGCGNAYDPPVMLVMPGYHANGFIDVVYSSSDYDPQIWADDVQRRAASNNGAPANDKMFNCVVNPPPNVTRTLRNAKIFNVQIGYDLTDKSKWCGRA